MSLDLGSYFGFTRTPFRRDLAPSMLHRLRSVLIRPGRELLSGEVGPGFHCAFPS